jgi:hypothetical protein
MDFSDYDECYKSAFLAAAVSWENRDASGYHILIYKCDDGTYWHTGLLSDNSEAITDDEYVDSVDVYNPFDIYTFEEGTSLETAAEYCYDNC